MGMVDEHGPAESDENQDQEPEAQTPGRVCSTHAQGTSSTA